MPVSTAARARATSARFLCLPPEIVDIIVSQLDDQSLVSLRLATRHADVSIISRLFRRIRFSFLKTDRDALLSIAARADLAVHVRELDWYVFPQYAEGILRASRPSSPVFDNDKLRLMNKQYLAARWLPEEDGEQCRAWEAFLPELAGALGAMPQLDILRFRAIHGWRPIGVPLIDAVAASGFALTNGDSAYSLIGDNATTWRFLHQAMQKHVRNIVPACQALTTVITGPAYQLSYLNATLYGPIRGHHFEDITDVLVAIDQEAPEYVPLDDIVTFIRMHSRTLESLEFAECDFTMAHLDALATVPNLHLRILDVFQPGAAIKIPSLEIRDLVNNGPHGRNFGAHAAMATGAIPFPPSALVALGFDEGDPAEFSMPKLTELSVSLAYYVREEQQQQQQQQQEPSGGSTSSTAAHSAARFLSEFEDREVGWPALKAMTFSGAEVSTGDIVKFATLHAPTLRVVTFIDCTTTFAHLDALATVAGLGLDKLQVFHSTAHQIECTDADLRSLVNGRPHVRDSAAYFAAVTGRPHMSSQTLVTIDIGGFNVDYTDIETQVVVGWRPTSP
ncbi:hypothetical protein Micbo1qcDRAFT_208285 [Microdochium bolleyi]|uniref:F-box domain-containing protein n=1 Tax=Microdochium bolleyi TaxID=196109 RepID=A0A136IQQ1_9PEZI|nr:hypothetical protein Micbo1qcDRAFT_208285 [Microdochium bolleyi]